MTSSSAKAALSQALNLDTSGSQAEAFAKYAECLSLLSHDISHLYSYRCLEKNSCQAPLKQLIFLSRQCLDRIESVSDEFWKHHTIAPTPSAPLDLSVVPSPLSVLSPQTPHPAHGALTNPSPLLHLDSLPTPLLRGPSAVSPASRSMPSSISTPQGSGYAVNALTAGTSTPLNSVMQQAPPQLTAQLVEWYNRRRSRIIATVASERQAAALAELSMWLARRVAESAQVSRLMEQQRQKAAAAKALEQVGATITSPASNATPTIVLERPTGPRTPEAAADLMASALRHHTGATSIAVHACVIAATNASSDADAVSAVEQHTVKVWAAANEDWPWLNRASDEMLTAAARVLDDFVFVDAVFSRLWRVYATRNADKDNSYMENVQRLQLVPDLVRTLGVRRKFVEGIGEATFAAAVESLRAIVSATSPAAKQACLIACPTSLCRAAEEHMGPEAGAVGADDLLPLLSYVVVLAAVPRLHAHCALVADFMSTDAMNGLDGYTLAIMQTAVGFITTWKPSPPPSPCMQFDTLTVSQSDDPSGAGSDTTEAAAMDTDSGVDATYVRRGSRGGDDTTAAAGAAGGVADSGAGTVVSATRRGSSGEREAAAAAAAAAAVTIAPSSDIAVLSASVVTGGGTAGTAGATAGIGRTTATAAAPMFGINLTVEGDDGLSTPLTAAVSPQVGESEVSFSVTDLLSVEGTPLSMLPSPAFGDPSTP